MRYPYCRKNHRISGFCIQLPVSLIHGKLFRHLSIEACFLYSCLLNAQSLINMPDKKGHCFVLVSEEELSGLLRCERKEAVRVLGELSESAGLVTVKRESAERLKVYVKNFEKPILPPNARRKFGGIWISDTWS